MKLVSMKSASIIFTFSLIFLTGCPHHVRVSGGHGYIQSSPPSYAPAYGHRRNHRYHYYPNAEIYFDVGRNMYFYLNSRNQWSFSVNLPIHLRSHLHGGYVEFDMENERPYLRHRDHQKKYKSRKYKNKLKYRRKEQRFETRQQEKYQDKKEKIKQKYKNKEQRYEERQRRKYERKKNRTDEKYDDEDYKKDNRKKDRRKDRE